MAFPLSHDRNKDSSVSTTVRFDIADIAWLISRLPKGAAPR